MSDAASNANGVGRMWPSGERFGVTFERAYAAAPADVWAAITDEVALAAWFAPVSGDFQTGGRYEIDFGQGAERQTGEIRDCDAPSTLSLTWDHPGEPASLVTVRLAGGLGGGTNLILEHDLLPGSGAAGYSAGWHAYLDRLTARLTGNDLPDWEHVFNDTIGHYKRQLAMIPTIA
ncbi:MAG TPA: SRPBCC domain-containing protein [Thermomicrobiales bacterium]|jgi:uncharacterized protein YndB with AHSA1/START domain|nr:SRPBCC domain-containing protein [Thermomicrobiales bacterium]